MKVITWNVNGYRAAQKKGFREWFDQQQPDVLCLQEIKVKVEQLTEEIKDIPGYTSYWNPAERPGYSGVAMFIKNELMPAVVSVEPGIPDARFDDEGRVLRLETESSVLYGIYFPNGQRGQDRVDYKLEFYASLLEKVKAHRDDGKTVIITGDFNTAHHPIDLKNPKENEKNSGFLPSERLWVDHYVNNGFVDAYRLLYPDKVEYTWWSQISRAREKNVGWRLDYFLVSEASMPLVNDVQVQADVMGSDHCPVLLDIKKL